MNNLRRGISLCVVLSFSVVRRSFLEASGSITRPPGAGGLGTGLDLSGFVETRAAIEFSPSAAQTYASVLRHRAVWNLNAHTKPD
jgi:hypothetical protein